MKEAIYLVLIILLSSCTNNPRKADDIKIGKRKLENI